jgi:hypothetical protein
MKMNVLLAKTEHTESQFKALIKEYIQFFKNSQGAFRGVRGTYEPRAGTIDEPSKRGFTLVITTVSEKLQWLEEVVGPHITALMNLEATNASGNARAEVFIDEHSLGQFSSLELLRMISLLEKGDFEAMYSNVPVRTETESWKKSEDENYRSREVYENDLTRGVNKTTLKEDYILPDPNAEKYKEGISITPQVSQKTTVVELGDYTIQRFSGEISHRERAEILLRRTKLIAALKEALKKANEAEVITSNMTAQKLFNYLHRGQVS